MNESDPSATGSGAAPSVPPSHASTPPTAGPPPRRRAPLVLGCIILLSFLLNIAAVIVIAIGCLGFFGKRLLSADSSQEPLVEKAYENKTAGKGTNKVVIISLEGIILEGQLEYLHRQIEQAEKDPTVKAVVFRINSPGGSVTASDDIHRRISRLTAFDKATGTAARPLIVSMGSLAASGGYYVAMPGQMIYCERTGVTGSIGVYAAFPNVSGLMEKYRVKMNVIKQGNIKDSGSPFKPMLPEEEAVWQDMVDHAYRQFVQVVEEGRPKLKGEMLKTFDVKPLGRAGIEEPDEKKWLKRYRADGGIYTSDEAVQRGLIDKIGTLDDAVDAAIVAAKLSDYRVVQYEKPKSLASLLFGVQVPQTPALLDTGKLKKGLLPRVWLLAPGCELAGMAAAIDEE